MVQFNKTEMVSYAEPSRKPRKIFIAVMGVTGSGKSSFIATATGSDAVGIGHDFKSCAIIPRLKWLSLLTK